MQSQVPDITRPPLLHPRRRPGQGARGPGARPAAAADGRRGAPAHRGRCTVPDYTPYGRARARGDAARPGTYVVIRWRSARSTGCRRCSTRTPTRRSRTSTTSRRWSQPLLFNVDGRLLRARSSRACGPRRSPRRPTRACRRCRPTRRASRCTRCRRSSRAAIESSGLAALPARPLGPGVPRRDRGGHQGRRRWPAPTCCWCPTATRPTTRRHGDPYGLGDLGPEGQARDPRLGRGRRALRRLARRRRARRGRRHLARPRSSTPRTLGISSPGA